MGRILADSDLPRLQQFVQNLLSVSGQIPDQSSHTDLIAWNIDRGLCVKGWLTSTFFLNIMLIFTCRLRSCLSEKFNV